MSIRTLILAAFLFASPSNAAVVTAQTCSRDDVKAAVSSASNGDTVAIPAGTCKWVLPLKVTKGIALAGAGVGQTVILDGIQGSDALIYWECVPGKTSRLTGIEFRNGGRTSSDSNGRIRIDCTNTAGTTFRLDHNKLERLSGAHVRIDTAVGVFDHNEFITSSGRMAMYIYDSRWLGLGDYGDNSWASPVVWGSNQFLFIEDNTFTAESCIDGWRGTRAVFRHNTFLNCHITGHGTESSGRSRGMRAYEIYWNLFVNKKAAGGDDIFANIRSGSALIWGNAGAGLTQGGRVARLNQDRAVAQFAPFGKADGTSVWDVNSPELFAFVATGSGKLSVTVAGAGWEADQWRGYSIRKAVCTPTTGQCHSAIMSNTSDTLAFAGSGGFGNGNLGFVVGEAFQVRRVLQALDGIGRSGGGLIVGNPPIQPAPWLQLPFPLYEWDNSNDGRNVNFARDNSCVPCVAGEHYFNDTMPVGYVPYTYPHPLTRLP